MRSHRVFIRNGRPCVVVTGWVDGNKDARILFDIAHPPEVRPGIEDVGKHGIESLHLGEHDSSAFYRPGYVMREGCDEMLVLVMIGRSTPVLWFRLQWKDDALTVVEHDKVARDMADLYGRAGTATEGKRYYFRVTRDDIAAAATHSDPRIAAEDLLQFTFRVDDDERLDEILEGRHAISCASLSQQRLTDMLLGIIVGFRIDQRPLT